MSAEDKMNENAEVLNQVLMNLVQSQKETIARLQNMFYVTVAGFTSIIVAMVIGFFVYESQFDTEYTTTEEVITQEVSGEGSNINNVDGDQYNDNAVHNSN